MAAQLDLLGEQCLAGAAIFGALVGMRALLARASSAAGFSVELSMDVTSLLMADFAVRYKTISERADPT